MEAIIFLVDMQSFYASIEKARRPELRKKPVVVSGDPRRRSGIILAACPVAKSYGIRNAMTLWEAQRLCPQVVVIRPQMQLYVDISLQLTRILTRFSDQVEPYSIDEQFVDVTGSQTLFGKPDSIAVQMQMMIAKELQLPARIGIGPNKVLAKMACDLFAKRNQRGIYQLDAAQVKMHLWPLPVENLFGVGKRMQKHLNRIGIRSIGDLANFPLPLLKKYWGVNGHVLWMTANGRDLSPVTANSFHTPKGIGHQLTLPYDYRTQAEIDVVLLELCDAVGRRSRQQQLAGTTVMVHCRTSDFAHPAGFRRQTKLATASNCTTDLFHAARACFVRHWQGEPIRQLGLQLSGLKSDRHVQLDLFTDVPKQRVIDTVADQLKQRFGATAILRASSLLPAGQARASAKKIGGHTK